MVKWLRAWTREPDCPGLNCVVLGKPVNLPVSSFPYLQKEETSGISFREFL